MMKTLVYYEFLPVDGAEPNTAIVKRIQRRKVYLMQLMKEQKSVAFNLQLIIILLLEKDTI